MRKLYEFFLYCGRMGELDGLFISTETAIKKLIGTEVHFGEVLGKHSDVSVVINEDHFRVISEDQEKLEWLVELLGDSVSGYNPFDFIDEEF